MDSQELLKLNALLDREVELREVNSLVLNVIKPPVYPFQSIKEQVNELDKKTRTMIGLLNKIHSTPSAGIPALLISVQPLLLGCQENTLELSLIIPKNQFWRWKDLWSNSIRTAVFAAALIEYLTSRTLLTLHQAAEAIGIKEEWSDRITLPVEDYLHALISLVNELARLAVNAVTLGNFDEPIKISFFVKDIFVGFTMLNLKNDTLRRRYDSLKYDIKKVEEVVYDVSLRKLAPTPSQT